MEVQEILVGMEGTPVRSMSTILKVTVGMLISISLSEVMVGKVLVGMGEMGEEVDTEDMPWRWVEDPEEMVEMEDAVVSAVMAEEEVDRWDIISYDRT